MADGVDFVLAASRDRGDWRLSRLPDETGEDIEVLLDALGDLDGVVLGLVSVDEDFFVLARVEGDDVAVLLSDVTAVDEWPLADSVAELLDVPDPDEDDDPQPAGDIDIDIVSDLGVSAVDLAVLCDDADLLPEEVLGDLAGRLGFGEEYAALVADQVAG